MNQILSHAKQVIGSWVEDERGQGVPEYALILALIAVVAIAALTFLSGQVNGVLSTVGSSL